MKEAIVLNIQRFSPHDGDGLRTTVFFKGCGLHCKWCHNPESQKYEREVMVFEERCRTCGYCLENCKNNAIKIEDGRVIIDKLLCKTCSECIENCAYSALEMAGKYYTVDEIVDEVRKDLIMYEESGGGVTLSGGEVMTQDIDFLLELCKRLERHGISINIDTCGLAPRESYEKISKHIDMFLYDIKTTNEITHKEYIGDGLDKILDNLKTVNSLGSKINIRIPIIGGVNDTDEEIAGVINWLKDENIKVEQINLLPYHNTGSSKYDRIGKKYEGQEFKVPSKSKMEEIKINFIKNGFNNIFIGG